MNLVAQYATFNPSSGSRNRCGPLRRALLSINGPGPGGSAHVMSRENETKGREEKEKKGKRREGKRREGKERKEKGREGKEREGKRGPIMKCCIEVAEHDEDKSTCKNTQAQRRE